MRLLTKNALVRVGKPAPKPAGQWLGEIQNRGRIGKHPATSVMSKLKTSANLANQYRALSDEDLWKIYVVVPEVRATINSISRRVATWDWTVQPIVDPSDKQYDELLGESVKALEFLNNPNMEKESWQTLMTKLVIDILVYDVMALELVESKSKKLVELVAVRSSQIKPMVNEYGQIKGYVQEGGLNSISSPGGSSAPVFDKDQLVYERMFPTTSSQEGIPLLECIVNEVITIMRSSDHLMQALDADEIPPGILLLAGLDASSAKRAKEEFSADRGKDHKIRVLTTGNPNGMAANWIELRRTPKELTMQEAMDQVRRTIWRVFGVAPIEMGETDAAPRAQAEVQVSVASSHLIIPLLEMIGGFVNNQILPRILSPSSRKLIKFSFDVEAKLSAQDDFARAGTHEKYINSGVMTRNEVRHFLGLRPIPSGDIPTVKTGAGPMPLKAFLKEAAKNPSLSKKGGDADASSLEPVDDQASPATSDEAESKPPKKKPSKKKPKKKRHECLNGISIRSRDDLPSDWQTGGKFEQYRTLNLPELADTVIDYAQTVETLWNRAQSDVMSLALAMIAEGDVSQENAVHMSSRFGQVLDKLGVDWAVATRAHYRQAAKQGMFSARDFTHVQVVEDWESRGDLYGQRAMGFLMQSTGPIGEVKTRIADAMNEFTSSRLSTRSIESRSLNIYDLLLVTLAKSFSSQFFRIFNWSGKLVELANSILRTGLGEGGVPDLVGDPEFAPSIPGVTVGVGIIVTPGTAPAIPSIVTPEEPGEVPELEPAPEARDVWYAEWVYVGDSRMCPTCSREGSRGIQPMDSFKTSPGGDTECGAKCRCVMVIWTESEVRSGEAIELGGQI